MRMTLAEAISHAPEHMAALRLEWADQRLRRAVDHHAKRGLRCDTAAGTTSDRDGNRSRFVNWTKRDATRYENDRGSVFYTFFWGDIANSCSRLARGLKP